MLDMYDFNNDVWLCHSFRGQCFNVTSFVSESLTYSLIGFRVSYIIRSPINWLVQKPPPTTTTSNLLLMCWRKFKCFWKKTLQKLWPSSSRIMWTPHRPWRGFLMHLASTSTGFQRFECREMEKIGLQWMIWSSRISVWLFLPLFKLKRLQRGLHMNGDMWLKTNVSCVALITISILLYLESFTHT